MYILFRSEPKILMAIFARVPESIWSILWEIGWPMVTLASLICESFSLTSSKNSSRLLSSKRKGTSISDELTPCACSSNSARPVLRVVEITSGILNRASSTLLPILLLSSSDSPGNETAAMVSAPSLNSGKKLLPNWVKAKIATTSIARAEPINSFFHFMAYSRKIPYPFWSLLTSQLSLSCLISLLSSVSM